MFPSAHIDTYCRENLPPSQLWPTLNQEFIDANYSQRLNACTQLLDKSIATFGGGRRAIIAAEGEFTYQALLERVCQCSNFLVNKGVQPGNRVLLRGPNNASTAILWLAIIRIGAVAVTTISLQRASELEKMVAVADVQFAAIDHRFTDEWENVNNFKGTSFIYGGESDLFLKVDNELKIYQACDTSSDDVAILAFTSGSTGTPKATMHFHRDILAICDTFSKEILKANGNDIFVGTAPLAFTFGLGASLVFPLRIGASTLLLESSTPPILLEKISEFGITVLFTAPTAYRAMLKVGKPELTKSLRRCVSAGEHLPESTWHAWHDATGIKLIDGIGSTEMLHIFISASDDEIHPGMTGKAVPGYEAMVVDNDFNVVQAGEIGFLAVRGPTGVRYLHDERQKVYSVKGWNVTGDLYLKDAQGYFKYQSRADDMIISSGYNIAAPEVENALLTHSDVAEVAVVGEVDADRGTLVVAYVVLNQGVIGDEALVKQMQDWVKSKIAPFKYPRRINFVESLPKTTTGKLQRFRLKDQG